ncbi:MAG TPA: dephospho-CoA kinase [Candidatus Dormibacteraeota bacterium]|nr:dephospho-CoA kinase [Candidatus Dormibacteraeota bacterium]
MKVLGLTGGIGSGKSMVASMFAQLGADVIDADQLARDVVEPGQPALEEIAAALGREILLPDGRLDRGKLARIIFAEPLARAKLNAITHPRIQKRMAAEIAARASRPGVLIADIPLLYENERTGIVEAVIVVWVDPQTQLRRLLERDRLTEQEARQRIAAQMALDEKRARADVVIDNSGSRENTQRQVEAIYRRYAPMT